MTDFGNGFILEAPAEPAGGDALTSATITLAVVWHPRLLINDGAATAILPLVELSLKALSTAGDPVEYRLREQGGAWSAWTVFEESARRGWLRFAYELAGDGLRYLDAQYRDESGNLSPVVRASITVLTGGISTEAAAGDASQLIFANVLAYYGGQLVAELEATDGSVSADARRSVWRTASIGFAPGELTHREIYELLRTPGLELVVRRGWRDDYGGVQVVPLGRFVVDEASYTEGEAGTEVSAECSDLAVRIQRARWTAPHQILAGTTLVDALAELLIDRWGGVQVGFDAQTTDDVLSAGVVLEAGADSDPWADAQGIARAHGYVLHFDREGIARLTPPPDPANLHPAYHYRRDEEAVVTATSRSAPLERTYSGVVATGEGSSLEVPVRAEAWDEDPRSPTCVHGPFGRVPYFYSSPLMTTVEMCELAAASLLSRVLGRLESLEWEQVPNPGVQPLEAVELEDADGTFSLHVIDEVTVPLSPAEAQTAAARQTSIDDAE